MTWFLKILLKRSSVFIFALLITAILINNYFLELIFISNIISSENLVQNTLFDSIFWNKYCIYKKKIDLYGTLDFFWRRESATYIHLRTKMNVKMSQKKSIWYLSVLLILPIRSLWEIQFKMSALAAFFEIYFLFIKKSTNAAHYIIT